MKNVPEPFISPCAISTDEELRMNRMIPTGISDFRALASGSYLFVDKTLMIRDLVELGERACMFFRPRRFGKSMSLSMLEAFFDDSTPDGGELFSGLRVSGCPDAMEHMGRYKVIRMDFTYIEASNMKLFRGCFADMMSNIYAKFERIGECEKLSQAEREQFRDILYSRADDGLLLNSVSLLCRWVRIAYEMETVILIDEFDKPVYAAYANGFYDEFMDLFSSFVESSLKNNRDYRFATVIAVADLRDGTLRKALGDVKSFGVLDAGHNGSFGFTEEEVSSLVSEEGLPAGELDIMRACYGGYRFGNRDMHCPYSVMNRLQRLREGSTKPLSHWAQSGDGCLLSELLARVRPGFRDDILALRSRGNAVRCSVCPRLALEDLQSTDASMLEKAVLTLMVTSGYLRAVACGEGAYLVTVPNEDASEAIEEIARHIDVRFASDSRCKKNGTDEIVGFIPMKSSG